MSIVGTNMNYCNFCGRYDDTTTITLPDKYQPQQQQQERIVVDLCERCTNELEQDA
jgi:hypothetical protein